MKSNNIVHLNRALAKQLKELRENEGKTLQELSKILGYNVATLRSKETNGSTITTQDLITYATHFKLFPSDIVSMAEQDVLKH